MLVLYLLPIVIITIKEEWSINNNFSRSRSELFSLQDINRYFISINGQNVYIYTDASLYDSNIRNLEGLFWDTTRRFKFRIGIVALEILLSIHHMLGTIPIYFGMRTISP